MGAPVVQIASLEINTNQVIKESSRLKGNLEALKKENKALAAAGKDTSDAFQTNAAKIANLSKEYSDNQKLAASLIAVSKDTARTMATEGKSVQQLRVDRAKLQQIGKNIIGDTEEEIQARNKLNKAIDAQTELIKSDASPAYVRQADNVGNYITQQTKLGSVIQQGNNILNVAKGIYAGYGDSIKAAFQQIVNAKAGTEGLSGAQKAGAVTTNALSGALKILKLAFAATGIGLVVLAIISLVSYFSKTQEGADKLSKVLAAVGAVIDVLVDRISAFGGAIVQFFSGDFSGGFDKMKQALSGLGDEMIREAGLAYDLEAAFQAVEDREIGLIKTQAERKKSIEELRLAAKDETKDLKDRARLLEQAGNLEKDVLKDQLEIAKERARISAERLALGESTRAEIKADAELAAQVIELETQSLKLQRSIEAEKQGLLKRSRAEGKAANDARLKDQVEAYNTELEIFKTVNAEKLKTNIEALQELKAKELEIIQEKLDNGLIRERAAVLERLKVDNKYLEGKAAIDEAELARVQEFEDRKKSLEDRIRLAKITDEREREEFRIEQEYEKHLLELENLELREGEKTELLALLREERALALNEVEDKYDQEALDKKKALSKKEAELEEQKRADKEKTLDFISGLAGAETGIGKAALIAKQILAAKEQAINLGLFTSKASLKLGEVTTDIAAGTAKSAAAAPFPANLPLIAGFIGTVAGIVGTIKKATSSAKKDAKPKAARGMLLKGARHSGGGIDINAEDGEAIINRRSTAKYLPVLSAMNIDGGGRPLMEAGGIAGSSSYKGSGLIDYKRLGAEVAQAYSALPAPQVSVKEISDVAGRVRAAESLTDF